MSRSNLAELLLGRNRADEALELAEAAWVRRQRKDIPPQHRAETAFVLARALWESGQDRIRARTLAEQAAQEYRSAGSPHIDAVDEIEAWLHARPL